MPSARLSSAVTTVQPALGPSLGVAPAGTCTCSALAAKKALSGCCDTRKARA